MLLQVRVALPQMPQVFSKRLTLFPQLGYLTTQLGYWDVCVCERERETLSSVTEEGEREGERREEGEREKRGGEREEREKRGGEREEGGRERERNSIFCDRGGGERKGREKRGGEREEGER